MSIPFLNDRFFRRRNGQNARILLYFKTSPCPNPNCPFKSLSYSEDILNCPFYHSECDKRRFPFPNLKQSKCKLVTLMNCLKTIPDFSDFEFFKEVADNSSTSSANLIRLIYDPQLCQSIEPESHCLNLIEQRYHPLTFKTEYCQSGSFFCKKTYCHRYHNNFEKFNYSEIRKLFENPREEARITPRVLESRPSLINFLITSNKHTNFFSEVRANHRSISDTKSPVITVSKIAANPSSSSIGALLANNRRVIKSANLNIHNFCARNPKITGSGGSSMSSSGNFNFTKGSNDFSSNERPTHQYSLSRVPTSYKKLKEYTLNSGPDNESSLKGTMIPEIREKSIFEENKFSETALRCSHSMNKNFENVRENLNKKNYLENIHDLSLAQETSILSKESRKSTMINGFECRLATSVSRGFIYDRKFSRFGKQASNQKFFDAFDCVQFIPLACAILNTADSTLWYGINNKNLVKGISLGRKELDYFQLDIDSLLRDFHPPVYSNLITIQFHEIHPREFSTYVMVDRYVVQIDIRARNVGTCYFTPKNQLFIEMGGIPRALSLVEICDYIMTKFGSERTPEYLFERINPLVLCSMNKKDIETLTSNIHDGLRLLRSALGKHDSRLDSKP
jgi:hypothetical protein